METQFDQRRKRAGAGFPWVEALRDQVPRPRRSGEDDGGAFDDLTRSLAEEVPRREAMRRLGAGLTTAVLASLGLESAWGSPKGPQGSKRPKCDKGQIVCGNICCPSGSPCCGGACCQLGQTCCVGLNGTPHCATIGSSTDCSGCNDVCQSDETCLGAQCACSGNRQPRCEADDRGVRRCCAAGEKCCGWACIAQEDTCCVSGVIPGVASSASSCHPGERCCVGPENLFDPRARNVNCCTSTETCCATGFCVSDPSLC